VAWTFSAFRWDRKSGLILVSWVEEEEGGKTAAAGRMDGDAILLAVTAAGADTVADTTGDFPKVGEPEAAMESVLAAPPPKLKK